MKLVEKHEWKLSDNQKDTGNFGVRVECNMHYPGMKPHYLTVHENLVKNYLEASGGSQGERDE